MIVMTKWCEKVIIRYGCYINAGYIKLLNAGLKNTADTLLVHYSSQEMH